MASPRPAWVADYLEVLGLAEAPPSLAFLAAITTRQLTRIPFENFTKLVYWRADRPLVPVEEWLDEVRRGAGGGTCFMHNGHLVRLLRELEFDAHLVKLGDDHFAIVVRVPELGDEHVFVDCGSASPIFRPLRFEKDVVETASFGAEEIRLQREPDGRYHFIRTIAGQVIHDEWSFDPRSPMPDDVYAAMPTGAANWSKGSQFLSMVRMQLWDVEGERALSLINNLFSVRRADGKQTTTALTTVDEIEHVVAKEFGKPNLPVRQALEILASVEVDVFKPRFTFARRPRRAPA